MKEMIFFDRCFWCLEAFFSNCPGVVATEVGYANGNPNIIPEYEEVGKGRTGYEEVCRVFFDEAQISVKELCHMFLIRLNPRRVFSEEEMKLRENQSKILFVDAFDCKEAEQAKEEIEETFHNHLLTTIEPLTIYYKAEEEHQHYFKRHPEEAACAIR